MTYLETQVQGTLTTQGSQLTSLTTGQDLTHEQLSHIQDQLGALQRTRSEEDIRNSPQAQAWKTEIQIEEARKLLEEGKFRTAQKHLEDLRPLVMALPDEQARRRHESRLCALIAFCQWRLGQMKEANNLFRQAFALQPDNAKTAANAAYGALLVNEPNEAFRLGKKALELDSSSDDALAMVIKSLYLLNRSDEIESLLQEHREAAGGLQTLFTRSGIAIETGDYEVARSLATEVRDMAPDNPLSHRLYADVLFVSVRQQILGDKPILMRLTPAQRPALQEAETAATCALEIMRGWEAAPPQIEVFITRAGARELLGNIDGAVADCDEILKFDPDNESAHFMKGEMLLHFCGRFEDAISELRQVSSGFWKEDAQVLEAEALVALRQWSDVINVLEPVYSPGAAWREQMDLARLLLQAAYFGNDVARVEKLRHDLEIHYANEPAALTTLADLSRWQGDTARALELLQQAYELSDAPQNERIIFWIAQTQWASGDFSAAAKTLETIVDTTQPDMLLRAYLEILIQVGEYEKVIEITRQLRSGGRAIVGISEYEANAASEQEDFNTAALLFEQLSEDHPEDILYVRNAASMLLHRFPSAVTPAAVQADPTLPDRIERASTALTRIPLEAVNEGIMTMDFAFLRMKAGLAGAPESLSSCFSVMERWIAQWLGSQPLEPALQRRNL